MKENNVASTEQEKNCVRLRISTVHLRLHGRVHWHKTSRGFGDVTNLCYSMLTRVTRYEDNCVDKKQMYNLDARHLCPIFVAAYIVKKCKKDVCYVRIFRKVGKTCSEKGRLISYI